MTLEEARKLALAQTYQVRSDALQAMLVQAADSEFIGPIIIKLTELGTSSSRATSTTSITKTRSRIASSGSHRPGRSSD